MARQVRFENRVISVPDDATDDEVASIIDQASSAPAAPPVSVPASAASNPPTMPKGLLELASDAIGEPLLQMATGLGSSAVGGLRGIADLVTGKGLEAAAQSVKDTQQAGTYQPRSTAGQVVSEVANYVPGKISEGSSYLGEKTADVTGSPALGAAVKTAGDVVGNVLLGKGAGRLVGGAPKAAPAAVAEFESRAAAPKSADSAPASPAERVVAAKYKVRPSDIEASGVKPKAGTVLEQIGGSGPSRRNMIEPNQQVTDTLARKGAGLEGKGPLTDEVFDKASAPHNRVYQKVAAAVKKPKASPDRLAQIENAGETRGASPEAEKTIRKLRADYSVPERMSGADLLASMRRLRKDANADFAKGENAVGAARRSISKSLEGILEDNTSPELLKEFQGARESLAKLYTVRDATRNGRVDAHQFAKNADDATELTPEFAEIVNAAKTAPAVTAHPNTLGDKYGNDAQYNFTGVKGTGGGFPVVGGIARKILESDFMQRRLAPQTGKAPLAFEPGLNDQPPRPDLASALDADGQAARAVPADFDTGGLTLVDDLGLADAKPPSTPKPSSQERPAKLEQPAQQQQARASSLAADLGLEVIQKTSGKYPGSFIVRPLGKPNEGIAVSDYAGVERVLDDFMTSREEAPNPVIPPRKKSGAVPEAHGTMPVEKTPLAKVTHKVDHNEHTFESPNGGLIALDEGDALRVKYVRVKDTAKGNHEGVALLKAAVDKKGKAISDFSVSPEQIRVYESLERRGYKLKRNPATVNKDTGNLVTDKAGVPVFEITRGSDGKG